ncbi:MAG: dihydrolipoamide dehydrogenase [Flavobacteriaceae bacterium]|nr:dihydrolipoamide dehydrogenase [Flavobacteriaceae bacterium]|tara:strand:+ start:1524 stop:2060 length:537 start_codon:yes stop_codon:yes gene_type:complete
MRQITLVLAMISALFFTACEGDQGPPGEPGINILGQVFEYTVDFQYDPQNNTYTTDFLTFPSNVEVFESDVVLVYRLEGQDDIGGGQVADVWSQLPQNIFYQDGTGDIFQYIFTNTFVDIQFIIEGNFDLTTLDTEFYNDQTFRVAIVPAEFADANLTMQEILESSQMEIVNFEKPTN